MSRDIVAEVRASLPALDWQPYPEGPPGHHACAIVPGCVLVVSPDGDRWLAYKVLGSRSYAGHTPREAVDALLEDAPSFPMPHMMHIALARLIRGAA